MLISPVTKKKKKKGSVSTIIVSAGKFMFLPGAPDRGKKSVGVIDYIFSVTILVTKLLVQSSPQK